MIIFHRTPTSSFADDVAEKLKDLVVAHRVEAGTENYILEGNRKIMGEVSIKKYLDELERELLIGQLFQSDTCIIDPESGTVC